MALKPNFTKKRKRKIHGATFWDREYTDPQHLKLSTAESEDLAKFTRWLRRRERDDLLGPASQVLDVGCGNGRNLIFLAKTFGSPGFGLDISAVAIAQAKRASTDLPLTYICQSASVDLPVPDTTQSLVLDMMTSHFLSSEERTRLRDELYRVLVPGGFLFMKTFLLDKDLHSTRLLAEYPGPEPGTYIHPVMGVPEHVYSEEELLSFLGEKFTVHKIYRSHKHTFRGRARKRRTISVYAEKSIF